MPITWDHKVSYFMVASELVRLVGGLFAPVGERRATCCLKKP